MTKIAAGASLSAWADLETDETSILARSSIDSWFNGFADPLSAFAAADAGLKNKNPMTNATIAGSAVVPPADRASHRFIFAWSPATPATAGNAG
jgi:hypothetical protein